MLARETGSTISFATFQQDLVAATLQQVAGWVFLPKGEVLETSLSGTHSIGQMAELYVIAATVIGGTSFAGGVGTIPGAIVGALLIQSLDNGMVLMDVSSAKRQIAIGLILIGAVWVDLIYTRKSAR